MIITDNFVFIHFPKTGGTFITKVLRRIHDRRKPNWWVNRLYNQWLGGGHNVGYREMKKHGSCREIPKSHQSKPIFSAVRDPFEWYTSEYFFGWWKRYPEEYGVTKSFMEEKYPSFPDLSFSKYVEACCEDFSRQFNKKSDFHEEFGWYSRRLIEFYFKEPIRASTVILNESISNIDYNDYMFDVRFLRTENLNNDLFDTLKNLGYEERNINFIHSLGRVRPDDQYEPKKASAREVFTPKIAEYILNQERLFFSIFDSYKTSNVLGVTPE